MKVISHVLLIVLAVFFAGCANLHRIEIENSGSNSDLIRKMDLSGFFIDNGFRKKPWKYQFMFGPAGNQDVDQSILAYWVKGPNETIVGRKSGIVQVWEVMEDQAFVVYIVGGQSRSEQAVDTVNNLMVALSVLYPELQAINSKSRFVDFR